MIAGDSTDWWHGIGVPDRRVEQHFNDRLVRCFSSRPNDIYGILEDSAARHGESTALVFQDQRLGYGALKQQVDGVAAGLHRLGIGAGDRVILFLGNRPEFIIAFFALQHLRAIATPIGVREQRAGLTWMANQCKARAIISEERFADRMPLEREAPSLQFSLDIDTPAWHQLLASEPVELPPALTHGGEESPAVILYTSGTTGHPKGAMLTHLSIAHSVMHYRYCLNLSDNDCGVLVVPGSHVTGLIALIMTMVYVGGRLLILDEFKAPQFLRDAAREKVTFSVMVPAMYKLCLLQEDFSSHDLSHWRIGAYGGAPMPEDTIDKLAASLPLMQTLNCYGSTETTSPVTIMPFGEGERHADSVGVTVPCGHIVIVDDEGREVPRGDTGELWIGGPMVVPGYWDNPAATSAEFTAGYWHSGDLGQMDTAGFVKVQDRKKDMLNRGGFKIYSVEVENVLAGFPGVVEAAVVGRPCAVLGERVHAFVYAGPGLPPDLDALRSYCAGLLADYKVPEEITLTTEPLPRNANGKLMKRLLRAQLQSLL